MDINLSQLQQLIHIAENAKIDELEVNDGEQNIRIVCRASAPSEQLDSPHFKPHYPSVSNTPAPSTIANSMTAQLKSEATSIPNNTFETSSHTTITAPMIGTFYLRASPEATPFVAVNDSVTANQTLCIIEAMKIMHEVKAEKASKITQILANEGEMVEYGQPLFVIE